MTGRDLDLERTPLPLDHKRQLIEQPRRDGCVLRLVVGRRGVVATYEASTRTLVKRVNPGRHAYRQKPGLAWNLEALAIADRWRPRPRTLAVRLEGRLLRVSWRTAREYAVRAAGGDLRYLVTDDVDRQVLIPWAAWEGAEVAPPPVVEAPTLFAGPEGRHQ